MVLADEIRALRDRALTDLDSAHDYHTDTNTAWQLVHELISNGHEFIVRSTITGTVTTQADLAAKAHGYVAKELNEATFQQFLAIFEHFLFELLRLWLTAYPESLGGKKVDFKAVLDAPDKESITSLVVGKELNEVLYDRPTGWFDYLESKAKLGCPSFDEIERIAEAKASRDVLVHGRGIVGKTYESKAGNRARYQDGDRIAITDQYHRETWDLLRGVISDISNAGIAKVS
ncbi:MAG: hypothetical protein WKF75_09710 [Singulisphaera sp.]